MVSMRALFAATLLASPLPIAAEVKLERRTDGLQVIRNEPAAARERRLSARLVAAPSARLVEIIDRCAGEHDVDARLVQAVMQAESGYNTKALSTKGAIGLMQLMPGTARELAVADPWDPEQNVHGGVAYLKRMLELFSHDLDFALAAYNAGPNAVLEHAGVPPYSETRAYVRKVRCLYEGDCGETESPDGRRVRVTRGADGILVLTTAGPGG